ncbi:hypothetical protein F4824DRAFT_511317 [Ustulina deusta]|nr:hypothetical protein F4824DRAFT_511317 [Ustulina deusta]
MHFPRSVAAASIAGVAAAAPRFAMYYDQWHTASPSKENTAGITHVLTAFADPLMFTTNPAGYYARRRRDNTTQHHSSVQGSLNTVEKYIGLGMDPAKMNLGIAFYAKYFETIEKCTEPVSCETAILEDAGGLDTGRSSAKTFLEGVPVLASGQADNTEGGQWYWTPQRLIFGPGIHRTSSLRNSRRSLRQKEWVVSASLATYTSI